MESGITQSIQTIKEDDLKWHCIVYYVTDTKVHFRGLQVQIDYVLHLPIEIGIVAVEPVMP